MISGSVKKGKIKFGAVSAGAKYKGTFSGTSMSGTWTSPEGGGSWSATKADGDGRENELAAGEGAAPAGATPQP